MVGIQTQALTLVCQEAEVAPQPQELLYNPLVVLQTWTCSQNSKHFKISSNSFFSLELFFKIFLIVYGEWMPREARGGHQVP